MLNLPIYLLKLRNTVIDMLMFVQIKESVFSSPGHAIFQRPHFTVILIILLDFF